MTWKELEQFNYDRLLSEALARVSDTVDKREGSVAYDMLAPAMYELAYIVQLFVEAGRGSLLENATGTTLDDFALRQGLSRYQASRAEVTIQAEDANGSPLSVNLGSRFVSGGLETPISYTITKDMGGGEYVARAEVYGVSGNSYFGEVVPLETIPNFGSAQITGVVSLAIDEESDHLLRSRVMRVIQQAPFGGNVSDYTLKINNISGVGATQVYPTWDGGGSVKLSVLGSGNAPLSPAKVSEIQELVDPTQDGSGRGIAPIGHIVTVVTPTATPVNVNATISTAPETSAGQLSDAIQENVSEYIKGIASNWGKADSSGGYSLTVFRSGVTSAIMAVEGVTNVSSLTINGSGGDLVLSQTPAVQEVPTVGSIIITGGA